MLARFVCPASRLRRARGSSSAAPSRPRSAPCSTAADWATSALPVEAVEIVGPPEFEPPGVERLLRGPARRRLARHARRRRRRGRQGQAPLRRARPSRPSRRSRPSSPPRATSSCRSRPPPASITRSAPSASTASSTSSPPPTARPPAPTRRELRDDPRHHRRERPRHRLRRRPRAVRLDRLLLVRRAGRGPPGAGPAVTRPLGVFSPPGGAPRVGARDGERVLDLAAVGPAVLASPSLNPLMAAGPQLWAEVAAIDDAPDFGLGDVELHLPFEVADYVDFYSSLEHATNLGRLFRPDVEPLLPNWRHLPVGYHGRAGTVVPERHADPAPERPDQAAGRRRAALRPEPPARHRARARLRDRAAEPARRAGAGRARARPRLRARARQRLERARHPGLGVPPLGPFLGKSFATSIGHWVLPLAALRTAASRRRRRSPSRCPTCARSRGRSTSRSRSSSTATSSRAPTRATSTGASPSRSPT